MINNKNTDALSYVLKLRIFVGNWLVTIFNHLYKKSRASGFFYFWLLILFFHLIHCIYQSIAGIKKLVIFLTLKCQRWNTLTQLGVRRNLKNSSGTARVGHIHRQSVRGSFMRQPWIRSKELRGTKGHATLELIIPNQLWPASGCLRPTGWFITLDGVGSPAPQKIFQFWVRGEACQLPLR